MKTFLKTIVIIILSSLGIFFAYLLYKDVENQILESQYQRQETYAIQATRSIQNFFENFQSSLQFISQKDEIINFTDKSKSFVQNYFEARAEILKAVTRISADGKILYTYPYVADAIGKDVSTQKHNKVIIETHKPTISDVIQTVQGYRAIIYAYPIFKDSMYNGCISLVIPFDYIAKKFLNNIRIGKTGTIFVLSEDGFELYCEQENHVGKNVRENVKGFTKLEKIIAEMLSNKAGKGEYKFHTLNSKEVAEKIVVYRPIELESTFWSVAVIMNKDEVLEANRGFVSKLIALTFLVTITILIFIYTIVRQQNKTREQLREKEIKHSQNLEKLVQTRTEELNELNKSLQHDIIERKKIEKELKLAIEKVEKSEKIKSEFLAQMSHEIRTPVNTILSFSALIKDELAQYVSQDLSYGFSGIQSAGKRLIRTIDLILNMSDIQLGTHDYLPKEIDLYENVIKDLMTEYKLSTDEKKLRFEVSIKTKDTKIIVDHYSVNQIFANLIDNAIKYTASGKIEIVLSRNIKSELVVSVIDTGLGISQEYLPQLFDEFSQEDRGYTRKFEGNGLGLSLVKKYCELNKATISVKSQKGIGSEFIVTFSNTIK